MVKAAGFAAACGLLALAIFGGCTTAHRFAPGVPEGAGLEGVVIFSEPTVLPSSSKIFVLLTETAGTPGEEQPVLARVELKPSKAQTIPFELPIDPAQLAAGTEYLVLANVVLDGKSIFSNLALPSRLAGGDPIGRVVVVLRPERTSILPVGRAHGDGVP